MPTDEEAAHPSILGSRFHPWIEASVPALVFGGVTVGTLCMADGFFGDILAGGLTLFALFWLAVGVPTLAFLPSLLRLYPAWSLAFASMSGSPHPALRGLSLWLLLPMRSAATFSIRWIRICFLAGFGTVLGMIYGLYVYRARIDRQLGTVEREFRRITPRLEAILKDPALTSDIKTERIKAVARTIQLPKTPSVTLSPDGTEIDLEVRIDMWEVNWNSKERDPTRIYLD